MENESAEQERNWKNRTEIGKKRLSKRLTKVSSSYHKHIRLTKSRKDFHSRIKPNKTNQIVKLKSKKMTSSQLKQSALNDVKLSKTCRRLKRI